MGKLKLSPNLFLEVNELQKMLSFVKEDGYKTVFKHMIQNFGISRNGGDMFKVSHKADTDGVIVINTGIAIDSDLNVITLKENKEIELPFATGKRWIIISYATTNNEEGTVSISTQGNLIGTNTKFLSVLRGQPNFPTKVSFTSSYNIDEYEVVEIISDTEATIVGSFVEENNLKYQVIGTFTPGFQPNDEDKKIYEYDYCNIEIIESEDKPEVGENKFVIASVQFVDGKINVKDERNDFFNYEAEDVIGDTIINNNPFVSLLKTKLVDNHWLDFTVEWGYSVHSVDITSTSKTNIIEIIDGGSNYIPNTNIPDNVFNRWKLLNRKNMVGVEIDYNVRNFLYVPSSVSSLITGEGDELVIIPNANNIEIEIKLLGTNYDDDTRTYFQYALANKKSKFCIPIEYLDTQVELKYRLINKESNSTVLQDFAITQFENINGEIETLGNSSFSVNITEPEENERNYS